MFDRLHRRSTRGKLALALGLTALAPLAFAQPSKKPAPTAPSASASVLPPKTASGSALGQIAIELTKSLGAVPVGAVVIVSPITSDLPTTKPDDLAIRIAAQIAGHLGAKAHDKPLSLAAARGNAGRAASLVYVQLEIAKGDLRATADLYPVVSNGWERVRNPAPGPQAHAFASASMDAEVRSFLTPIVLEQAKLHRAKHEEGDVIALGCGDVDEDGGNELVLATRTKVTVGKLRAGKFVPSKSVRWSEIASRAPVPMREPIASILVSPRARRGEILIGSTDRGAVAVDAQLGVKRPLVGLPVVGSDGDTCSLPQPESGAFEGGLVSCLPREKNQKLVELGPAPALRYDAVAVFEAIGKDGAVTQVVAAREPSAKLRLKRTEPGATKPAELVVDNVGAQLALLDLDLDGNVELVSTTDGETDTLVISSLVHGQLAAKLRYPARDGVRAVAACPPEENGLPAVAAVVGNEVWLVR